MCRVGRDISPKGYQLPLQLYLQGKVNLQSINWGGTEYKLEWYVFQNFIYLKKKKKQPKIKISFVPLHSVHYFVGKSSVTDIVD